MNTEAFQKAAEAEGYKIDEPNSLSPNKHNAEHTHPFDAMVIVLEGESTVAPAQTRPTARAILHHGRRRCIPRPSVRVTCHRPPLNSPRQRFDVRLKDLYRE